MAKSTTMTVHLKPEVKDKLDALARDTKRSKSHLASEAIERYVDLNEWQVAHIRAALAEDEAGGPGVPQPASNPVNAIANKSVTSAGFMKGEQQNNRRGLQPTDSCATAGSANYATSSFTPSRKTRVCWSMSEASVCGDINAILWNGVSRMPRFMA